MDSKCHIHSHATYIYSHLIKLLLLVRRATISFSFLECLRALYYCPVRSKLQCSSIVWYSLMPVDANKLKRIQQKCTILCSSRFFPRVHYRYVYDSKQWKLWTHLDTIFLVQVYLGSKFCLSLLNTSGLRVCGQNFRDFSLSCSSIKNCPYARCTSPINVVCRDAHVFETKTLSLNHILNGNFN